MTAFWFKVRRATSLSKAKAPPWNSDALIREELLSNERLEQLAGALAAEQSVTDKPPSRRSLNARLSENESALLMAYRVMGAAVNAGHAITPAAEWLLDNYHLVEQQIQQIHDDLPPSFYRQLPKLADGPLAGYPRVLGVAWACVAHADSRFDPEMLRRFVRAYQQVQPLTIGELWAVAITLRVVLIENLRRAAERMVNSRAARDDADRVADVLLGVNGKQADPMALGHHYGQDAAPSSVFVVQLLKRLRDQDPRVTPALRWLENYLVEQGTTPDQIVHEEHQRQGASNVTVRNIITSMRLISDVNWPEFFEAVSLIDAVLLAADNSDTGFAAMDFATRNLYRGAIEELARGSQRTELEIAHQAVAVARSGASKRERDPGYHLIAQGRRHFERAVGYRAPLRRWPQRINAFVGPWGYISAVVGFALAIGLAPVLWLRSHGVIGAQLNWLALLGIVPAIDLAVALVNRTVTKRFGATLLPSLALREGVPADLRTMVVVPTLLATAEGIEEQIERLEVHYLASAHGEVHFALLSDWSDAESERTAGDEALLQVAAGGIARLNTLYGTANAGAHFYLFHRRRLWNAGQQCWMGWERKRGKLHEFNRLLRGASDTTFIAINGQAPNPPAGVRFVITVDADTRLPRETVRRMVGKLAHPLNQPRFDVATGRVVEGYAVLQPRVTPSLPLGREGSLFQRVFSSMSGIDPYDSAVSDVYQDLFGEGSYAGKGIYDVDAFEAALADRVPENSLLSHDLFEGTFARAGLASDIEVVEEFPARYDVAAARMHRWSRGDWQLLPWMFGRGDALHRAVASLATAIHAKKSGTPKESSVRRGSSPLPVLGLWKMLDNLRRTLSAPACIAALLAGWLLPFDLALGWTGFVLATIALPALLPVFGALIPRRRGIAAHSHWRALGNDLWLAMARGFFLTVLLAHQAWLMTDAIVRTLYRLAISRRKLLEWITAEQTQRIVQSRTSGAYRSMIGSLVIAVAVLAIVSWQGNEGGWLALPFALLWIFAPGMAQHISTSPLVAGRLSMSVDDAIALRLVARRTWRFFETFVADKEHRLPPDNFQEDPLPVVAHRTSPTNMGLYLLSAVSARDFGWEGTVDVVARLEATLSTMHEMQRFRGHFYNWYDTRDLRPLDPRYISSVDSGNLAAHLLAVANACREWANDPAGSTAFKAGVADAMELMRESLQELGDNRRSQITSRSQLEDGLALLSAALGRISHSPASLQAQLNDLAVEAMSLADSANALAHEQDTELHHDVLYWADAVCKSIDSWRVETQITDAARKSLHQRLVELEHRTRALAVEMEFGFLLDPERKLLSIGYVAAEGLLDSNCYDLLASEARLASFIAIAKNDVPTRHWFRLGRAVTQVGHGAALISWSGSMFEYLMPSLVMRAPAGSLLEQTNRLIVSRQIEYGANLNVPWGVSESAYSARDIELTYQYSNFGVPGLGLKRGLSESIVIAPYATGLAAMVDPEAAVRNFKKLKAVGARGRYGFYEALDYTRERLPEGKSVMIVKTYMAHHQGMTIVSIANVLFDGRMRARFHAESSVRATELLLQERTPRDVSIAHPRAEEVDTAARIGNDDWPDIRRLNSPYDATPQTHLLANSRYAVMLTSAGSGYSRWRDMGVTRWHEDTTRDDAGSYLFLRDVDSGAVWSAGYQPSGVKPDAYEVTFTEDRAEFIRLDGALTTKLQVLVSAEDDAEVRRVSITNAGYGQRTIDVTSYSELVLTSPAADAAHPAFAKLFVQTEHVRKAGALLATRRRRANETEVWAAHYAVVEGQTVGHYEFETDRAQFLGRGREIHEPVAVMDGRPLTNTVGTVLDPIFALRYRIRVPPGATVHIAFWTIVAASRVSVLDLVDKHHDANAFMRASTFAWTQAQVQLRHLDVTIEAANLFQRLAGHVLYANPALRASSDTIQRLHVTRNALWAQGISGDLPLILVRIDAQEDIEIVRQLLQAHEYLRLKQLAVDLVILNERASSYVQDLQIALETLVRISQSRSVVGIDGAKGAVFVLRTDLISAETRGVLSAVARVVLVGQRGSLAEQLQRSTELPLAPVRPLQNRLHSDVHTRAAMSGELEFFNGMGGFTAGGREYVVSLDAGQSTPAPWINVIANPHFGFQIGVEGSGYTWSMNSRENQLTQWSNDPVTDRPGEVIYVRDAVTGALWSPTIAPVRDASGPYKARHGQGYSSFEHSAHGIGLELTVFVPLNDPIKIYRLKLRNISSRRRKLVITAYVEWVLGMKRGASAPFIITEIDQKTGAMFARNPWNSTFATRVAFADLGGRQTRWTADRREFLGRHGRLDQPAAFASHLPLSNRTGAGFDPCGALQAPLELQEGETTELFFFLGEAASVAAAQALLIRYRAADMNAVLSEVTDYWDDVLGTVQVQTPDRSLDIMLNRWMLYQTLVCRMWARSAFYQASGAYGFRDQLQDGMALAISRPAITREHLLRAAGRQFTSGDFQHWWLPASGVGVRTRISDDRVWLAYTALHYLTITGDQTILDEDIPFIAGVKLAAGEHDAFFEPSSSDEHATFFEHCARALDDSLALGERGLPLIGTGDWNDGMNRVGEHGRGESVWLGWFLHTTLTAFAPVASSRGEQQRSARWLAHAESLRASLERNAWDGAWYRRGYFDDGTPLGSAQSDECRIDSIAQSWSVISGVAAPARAAQAMEQLESQLIRRDVGLALLFAPPFDRTPLEPGYVKGYPPGIRENGGQYTHAAAWSVIAYAKLGRGDKATELFALLNPINKTNTKAGVRRYKVEPYVVAADIYSMPPHVGRGGWTWYTGSAGWIYRAGLESILGFQLQGDRLLLNPCIPKEWPGFAISFKYQATRYDISVENPSAVSSGVLRVVVDGAALPDPEKQGAKIALVNDGATHVVQLTLG